MSRGPGTKVYNIEEKLWGTIQEVDSYDSEMFWVLYDTGHEALTPDTHLQTEAERLEK